MARVRSLNRDKAYEIYKEHNGDIKLKDIAKELDIKDSQIRKWKSQDKWDDRLKGALPINKSNVTNKKSNKSNIKKDIKEPIAEEVKEVLKNTQLTEKQRFFCNEYLIDLNATRAYKAVYKNIKNDEVASVNGNRMLRNAKVKKYLDQRIKEREKRTEITQDFVIRELYAIAKSNGSNFARVVRKYYMRDIVDKEGKKTGKKEEVFYNDVELTLTDDLSEDKKKAIAAIKNTKFGIQVETCDKVKALELLGKHLGMFKDKVEVTGDINNPYKDLTTEELLIIAEGGGLRDG